MGPISSSSESESVAALPCIAFLNSLASRKSSSSRISCTGGLDTVVDAGLAFALSTLLEAEDADESLSLSLDLDEDEEEETLLFLLLLRFFLLPCVLPRFLSDLRRFLLLYSLSEELELATLLLE
jgi:hypothetical protein